MGIYDRDWSRRDRSNGRFWQDWPTPVRLMVVFVVLLVVVGLVMRNYRLGAFGHSRAGEGYEDYEEYGRLMMAVVKRDQSALADFVREDPELLTRAGTDFNEGVSLFDILLHEPNLGMLKVVLDAGADVAVVDAQGRSLLHRAARMGRADVVRMLIEQGIPVNTPDRLGFTALFDAAMAGEDGGLAVTEILLAHGARVDVTTADGQTAASVAQASKNFRVLSLLRMSMQADKAPSE